MKRFAVITYLFAMVAFAAHASPHGKDGGSHYSDMGFDGHERMEMGEHHGFDKLPKDKQADLKKMFEAHKAKMKPIWDEMKTHMDQMRDAMRAFPLDEKTAKTHWEAAHKLHADMFAERLSMMVDMQKIVGKDNWEMMHKEMGKKMGKGKHR